MNLLEKSIIVSAHPDDEILWFSSIVDKVDAVLVCFLGAMSHPEWAEARRQSLSEHSIQNITCLGIDEAEVFKGADWQNPAITQYGLAITENNISDMRYKKNYHSLSKQLAVKLSGFKNVITHNPWGEYGNEEHVQLYRVIKDLQEKMKFNLWFSNYSSNSSLNLMLQYISGFDSEYVTLQTNKTIGNKVMDIYKKNRCWTWYDDWEWFNEESFMKDRPVTGEARNYGHFFPVNIIKFNHYSESKGPRRDHSTPEAWRNLKMKIKHFVKKNEKGN